jgi:hypothetical protein
MKSPEPHWRKRPGLSQVGTQSVWGKPHAAYSPDRAVGVYAQNGLPAMRIGERTYGRTERANNARRAAAISATIATVANSVFNMGLPPFGRLEPMPPASARW